MSLTYLQSLYQAVQLFRSRTGHRGEIYTKTAVEWKIARAALCDVPTPHLMIEARTNQPIPGQPEHVIMALEPYGKPGEIAFEKFCKAVNEEGLMISNGRVQLAPHVKRLFIVAEAGIAGTQKGKRVWHHIAMEFNAFDLKVPHVQLRFVRS